MIYSYIFIKIMRKLNNIFLYIKICVKIIKKYLYLRVYLIMNIITLDFNHHIYNEHIYLILRIFLIN